MEKNIKTKLKEPIPNKKPNKNSANDQMQILVNKIKEDIFSKFPSDDSGYYVYTRYNSKKKLFKVFATLTKDTPVNERAIDIDFLIVINEEFPIKPPMVYCISYVISFYII